MTTTKYVLTNKQGNRVRIQNDTSPVVLSGELTNIYATSFTPVVYDSIWKTRLSCIGYGLKTTPVIMKPFDGFIAEKMWLYQISTGRVFRVYASDSSAMPLHRSCLVDSVDKQGNIFTEVMIKGVGKFPVTDFLTFIKGE